jgi:hypothetical protein
MTRLANWLFEGAKNYPEALEIYKELKLDASKLKFFAVAKPDAMRQNMLFRALHNHARIHNIRPAKTLKAIQPPVHKQKQQATPHHAAVVRKTPLVVMPHINFDQLPEDLKLLYLQTTDLHNNLKSYHNRLKLSTDQTEAQKLTSKIIETDEIVAANYAKLREWNENPEVKKQEEQTTNQSDQQFSDLDRQKRIEANLNYIRRYYLSDKPEQKLKVNERMQELDKWNVSYEKLIAKITGQK